MKKEADITVYNEAGEKVILKNQAAYYKAVECNRSGSDEFYNTLGTVADMNGDVGRQSRNSRHRRTCHWSGSYGACCEVDRQKKEDAGSIIIR